MSKRKQMARLSISESIPVTHVPGIVSEIDTGDGWEFSCAWPIVDGKISVLFFDELAKLYNLGYTIIVQ